MRNWQYFQQIVCTNMQAQIIPMLFILWMAHILLGQIPDRRMAHLVKSALACLLYIFVISSMGAVCYITGAWNWMNHTGYSIWEYFTLVCLMPLLHFVWRTSPRNCCLAALMVEILASYAVLLSELYNYGMFYDLSDPAQRKSYLFWLLIIHPLFLILCGLIIHISGMGKIYRLWLEQETVHKGILCLLVLYPLFNYVLLRKLYMEIPTSYYLLLPLFLLLLIHLIFVYVGRDSQQRQYIMAQQASLQQQTIYIEKMEQIQQELRGFRHDFKNMMAGMYLQAKEGDLDAVQNFIQEMTGDFDRQVGEQIRLLNQLGNVRMMEVKSLFLDKLTKMQQDQINCELEVLNPFVETRMRSTDLCRCLGIFIDNAMDEVRGRENGRVHMMISSLDGCTTFRIKNTLYGTVDFGRLGRSGYTTKGMGRGIGLENCRRILAKYDFVFPFTAVQDGYFVQELKIQE